MKRYTNPDLKGMQEAPGFWPVLPAGAKQITQRRASVRASRYMHVPADAPLKSKDKP